MAGETALLLEALAGAPDGLSRPELLARLREKVPYLQAADVDRVLTLAGEGVREQDGRIYAAVSATEPEPAPEQKQVPQRFVVFDLESIVRPIVKEPYREQHMFQLGAVRFGPDEAWVASGPSSAAFTALGARRR